MAKQKSLVCQYLENISRDALEKYQEIIRGYVRRRQGIYALYRRGKLYYVGLASNLNVRLKQHLRDRHHQSWDRFSVYITIGDSHMKELESLILRIVQPRGNKQKGKFIKSENLKRLFRRAISDQQKEEREIIVGDTSKRKSSTGKTIPKSKKGRVVSRTAYVNRTIRIKARYKGKTINAYFRKDGNVYYDGKAYRSPSGAAQVVCGRTCNGWSFWTYQRSPGDWVPIDELRK